MIGPDEPFEPEARVLASLNHPNITTIHGLERTSGATCLVMELGTMNLWAGMDPPPAAA